MAFCSLIRTFAKVIEQRKNMTEQFEEQLHRDLHQFLLFHEGSGRAHAGVSRC